MAKKRIRRIPSKKARVKAYTKKLGVRLPHGYELVVRKKSTRKRKR